MYVFDDIHRKSKMFADIINFLLDNLVYFENRLNISVFSSSVRNKYNARSYKKERKFKGNFSVIFLTL